MVEQLKPLLKEGFKKYSIHGIGIPINSGISTSLANGSTLKEIYSNLGYAYYYVRFKIIHSIFYHISYMRLWLKMTETYMKFFMVIMTQQTVISRTKNVSLLELLEMDKNSVLNSIISHQEGMRLKINSRVRKYSKSRII